MSAATMKRSREAGQMDLFSFAAASAPIQAPKAEREGVWYHDRRIANLIADGRIVLHKMGDFYEAFGAHAKILANALDIALTVRDGVPMAGIPAHGLDHYAEQLRKCFVRTMLADPAGERLWNVRTIDPEWREWRAHEDANPTPAPTVIAKRRLAWGKLKDPEGYPVYAKGFGYVLDIEETDRGVRYKEDYAFHNCGGGGPFSQPIADVTVEDVIEYVLRRKLRSCAHTLACDFTEELRQRQSRQLVDWIIEQLPPMFFPTADAQGLFDRTLAEEREKEARRCAMLRATHAIEEKVRQAALDADVYGYPDLLQDKAECDGSDESIRRSWKGHWYVAGAMPDGLEVVVYPYDEDAPDEPFLAKIVDVFAQAVDVPVRIANADELKLCVSDRKRVTY